MDNSRVPRHTSRIFLVKVLKDSSEDKKCFAIFFIAKVVAYSFACCTILNFKNTSEIKKKPSPEVCPSVSGFCKKKKGLHQSPSAVPPRIIFKDTNVSPRSLQPESPSPYTECVVPPVHCGDINKAT